MKRKALAFILRTGDRLLLVHAFATEPHLPWRLPGGGVEAGEDPLAALSREVYEETGLRDLQFVRLLGVQHYYKPYIHREVERHDFLLYARATTPDTWEHRGEGAGDDAGEVFCFHWLGPASLHRLDDEHRSFITPPYVPEFFE